MPERSSALLSETHYGDKDRLDCVLLVQHDGDASQFLNRFPFLRQAFCVPHRQNTLERYFAIDQDKGSAPLAHATAKALARFAPEYGSQVLEIHLPRAIIDINRIAGKALRNIFRYPHDISVTQELKYIHAQIIETLRLRIHSQLRAILVDIHTMAPFSPDAAFPTATEAISESPGTLDDYVDIWTNPAKRGERRAIDLVTEVRYPDGRVREAADGQLTEIMKEIFSARDIPFCFNHPYPTAPHIMSTEYMQRCRGIAVDVPKDLLTVHPAEDPRFSLENPIFDARKIGRIARAIADAVEEVLQINKLKK